MLSDGILFKFKTKESIQPMEEFDLCGRRNSQKFNSSNNSLNSDHLHSSSSSNSIGSNNSLSKQPQTAHGRILHNGKHVCGKDFSIALFQEGSETLILLASDPQEHSQWMNALNQSLPKTLRISQSSLDLNHHDSNLSTGAGSNSSSLSAGMYGSSSRSSSLFGMSETIMPPKQQSRMESMLQVLEAVLDPTVISDEEGTIVGFNKSSEELFGWRREEIISKNVKVLMPSMYAQFHDGYMERFKKHNDKRLIGKPRSK